MGRVDGSLGKREAHKKATREALQAAAERLFAQRGAADTTVRDIAAAAGVTERTFFRYFASKQDLIISGGLPWMGLVQEAIRRRPLSEPPLTAIHAVLVGFLTLWTDVNAVGPAALYADGPPMLSAGAASRPVMLKVESDLADVIEERLHAGDPHPSADGGRPDPRFEAEVLARVALALFRSVMLRDLALRSAGVTDRPSIATLLGQAFGIDGH